jgi:hypothetical protein
LLTPSPMTDEELAMPMTKAPQKQRHIRSNRPIGIF